MIFSSIFFVFAYLPIVLILYYLVPFKFKNLVLLLVSLVFYAWGEPVYVVLMLFSIAINFVSGLELEYFIDRGEMRKAKYACIVTAAINLGVLGFYKYYGFVIENLNAILPFDIPYTKLALPIGISFYTFQTMSYVIDVYRGKVKAQHNPITFGAYVSMFPQLIAGPIVRYSDVEQQLMKRTMSIRKFGDGVMWFLQGLGKKVLIANNMGSIYEAIAVLGASETSVLTAWIGCFAYTMQIYFDFGGYSDMAIGLGKMFGFEFLENFHYPYVSTSVTEFWRRWHISLSTWFREYVYIPLGGNRKGDSRTITNLLIVWMLTGFWHGAAWNFVAWGLYYGIILILEKFVWGQYVEKWPGTVRHIYAMVLILIGWVLFFSPSLGYALKYVGVMFGIGASGLMDKLGWFYLLSNWLIYLMAVLGSSSIGYRLMRNIQRAPGSRVGKYTMTGVMYLVMFALSLAFLVTQSFNPFLYFRF